MITIKNKEYDYDETQIINFAEGLIGLPEMRRAVLIPVEESEPFCWLASLDDERNRFIVVNPKAIFAGFEPEALHEPDIESLAIVKVSSDWRKTTVNLRAPIFVNRKTKRAAQFVLGDSSYSLAERIPEN